MKIIEILLLFLIINCFAQVSSESELDDNDDDNTAAITGIVMGIVFFSIIVVSVFVALVLYFKQKKQKPEDYQTL